MPVRAEDGLLDGRAWDTTDRGSLNPGRGGQFGWTPNFAELANNQAYVPRNATILALEAPKFFQFMPNKEVFYESFKTLVEKHARRFTGFKQGLEVLYKDHEIGAGNERQQEFTRVTRARTVPTLNLVEKDGRPWQKFFDIWIRFGMMDPDAQFALIATIVEPDRLPRDWLFDWYAGTILAYETDITNRFVDKAWLTTNFYPLGNGPVDAGRDLTADKDLLELDIEFSGASLCNNAVVRLAQSIHNNIIKTNASPGNMPAFATEVEPILNDIKRGYRASIERIGEATDPAYRGRPV